MSRPTVGRIVHYFEQDSDVEHAAMITRVHSDVCVDLEVWHQRPEKSGRRTSILSRPGDALGRWDWPRREEG